MLDLNKLIDQFFRDYLPENPQIEIYNEFSFQHELGIFLRCILKNYKIQFERNIKKDNVLNPEAKETIKKEMDILIFNQDFSEKYAIELKFPNNGMVPETMLHFVKDIKFMEEVKALGFTATACVSLVDDSNFYTFSKNSKIDGIYQFFRGEAKLLEKSIEKPTGDSKYTINLSGAYQIKWIVADKRNPLRKYYVVQI